MSRWSDLHSQKRSCDDVTMQEHTGINMVASFSARESSKQLQSIDFKKKNYKMYLYLWPFVVNWLQRLYGFV